jgi:hypothetical protein
MSLMSKPKVTAAKTSQFQGHPDADLSALATSALLEITQAHTYRIPPTVIRGEGIATVTFASAERGYPGWFWTVNMSDVEGITPTALELQLLPGDKALVAPEWVPWANRMEEYLLHEKELSDAAAEADDDDDDDDDDFDDDVDGIDIDQLDIELDPTALEVPAEPTDVFDHVEVDEADTLDR